MGLFSDFTNKSSHVLRLEIKIEKLIDLAYVYLETQLSPPPKPQHQIVQADITDLEEALLWLKRVGNPGTDRQVVPILERMYKASVGDAQLTIDATSSS